MVYKIILWVDGGCRNNGYPDAIGAYACIDVLRWGQNRTYKRPLHQGTPTSQRAEIAAIILALRTAWDKYENELDSGPWLDVTIYTDSKYVHGIMTDWVYKWCRNGWNNSLGNEIANRDYIEQASEMDDKLKEVGSVTYIWVSREENNAADEAVNEKLDEMEAERDRMQAKHKMAGRSIPQSASIGMGASMSFSSLASAYPQVTAAGYHCGHYSCCS